MQAPTQEQKAKEAAILYTYLADLGIVLLTFLFAILTLSLSLIGELLRMALMMVVDFYSFFILRAVHRHQLRRFRFGIGKVEQICHLAIGAALVVGGFWVAHRVVETLLFGQIAASPLGLAMAAVVNAINTLINALGWFAMSAAARSDDSAIYKAQLRSRKASLFSSLVVQATMTIAVLAKDPMFSTLLDGAGATFVVWIMVSIGLKMMWEAVPDLLDHRIPDRMQNQIEGVLAAAGLEPEELVRARTRRSGSLAQVELTLAPVHCLSLTDFKQRIGHLQRMIENHVPGAEVAIVVDAEGNQTRYRSLVVRP
jgi:divalent metal cation (Fe/Co/Zn/Cd) transporter